MDETFDTLTTEERARIGANARWHKDYARDLRARKLEAAIEEALSKAPPLTDEQCSHLRALLGGSR
jgi:hypothetical protein